jgi:UPF0042 nucleotide-binding protein
MSEAATLVVVTGMSGAGRSTALDALEDVGFYCVDNLPSAVIAGAIDACIQGGTRRLALGLDVRVRSFLEQAAQTIQSIRGREGLELSVLFLDASDEALVRRFSSTRRPHPLSTFTDAGLERGALALLDGVGKEREQMASLRAMATLVIDTTQLSVHELRRTIIERYGPDAEAGPRMHTRLVSFGFKYGTPVEADVVFDVRFIDNPFFIEALRDLTGRDQPVRDYVMKNPDTVGFVERALELLRYTLPRYEREGKSYLTVAIGCTGGQHRSVAVAEHLLKRLAEIGRISIDVLHRDIARALPNPVEPPPGTANLSSSGSSPHAGRES